MASATAENVEIAGVGITFQLLLDLKRQPLHAAPHVRVARRDPDPHVAGDRDHVRSAFNVAAISADDAPAPIRTRALFTSTMIAAASLGSTAVGEAVNRPGFAGGSEP